MTQQSVLTGKEFELNNFICTIKKISDEGIYYSFRNKSGHQFPDVALVYNGFLPKILNQLDLQPINQLEYE